VYLLVVVFITAANLSGFAISLINLVSKARSKFLRAFGFNVLKLLNNGRIFLAA
jgi:hypothetical protein